MFTTSTETEAKIHCSHNDDSFTRILWYKQSAKDLQLLGYLYGGKGNPETDANVKIDGESTKGKTCTLTIEGLSENSSAVYFCAASLHSVSSLCCSIQKLPDIRAAFVFDIALQPTSPCTCILNSFGVCYDLIMDGRLFLQSNDFNPSPSSI